MNTNPSNGNHTIADAAGGGKSLSLSALLPSERIRLDVVVATWQDAIRESGRLLYATGAVTVDYIEAMVKVAEELGPYIAIAPGIALPHASTEAGAKQTALSLVKLAEPINFGNPDNDPVRLVFGLAAIDHTAHVVALQALAELFLSKDLMARLFEANTAATVIGVFCQAERILDKSHERRPED
jgi:mannitol/fructose-specific phosphotransferase system IIA component (Ntr-type)